MSVAVRVDAEWRTIATAGWAQLVVVDGDSSPDAQRRTLDLVPSSLERANARALTLAGALDDATLGHCHFDVDLEIVAERRVAMTYSVTPEHGCRLVHFRGPHLLFDQDTLAAKDDALFPGLDWLVGPEESSATTNAAAALAVRSAPHPYKITVPLMALSAVGAAVGLWWDPLQLWCNAHAYPGALFALPERDENTPARGRMALFVPTPASRWTAENQTHAPYNVPPGARVGVRATLYAGPAPRFAPSPDTRPAPPAHGALTVLDEWFDVQGSIPPPVLPRSPCAALDLCLHSYTAQCWDPETHGWHHTLADPWGPRYEAGIAAQLWQAARLSLVPDGERCRAIVRAGVEAGRQKSATQPVPHLDLAFSYGGLEKALAATKATLGDLIAQQRADGAWPFEPTDERQRALGREGDSSSSLTADAAARLLRYARMTGDRAAEQAGLRGMAFLRTQPRPEGAQTWGLQVHVRISWRRATVSPLPSRRTVSPATRRS
jgi:hypothetical protein